MHLPCRRQAQCLIQIDIIVSLRKIYGARAYSPAVNHTEMKLDYRIDCKNGIILEKISGVIKFDELIDFQKSIFSDSKYNKSYSIFSDIRGSIFELSKSEKEGLLNFLSLFSSYGQRCAFLTDTPKEVVSSELIRIAMLHLSSINIQIFSTEAAVFQWLSIDKNYIIDFD